MASVLCFLLVAMHRSVVNWRKIAFSSTCRNLASGNVFQRKCCSLLPTSADNKSQQNEDRKFYTTISPYVLVLSGSICTVLWGSIHAECVGKENEIPCSSEKKVHDKTPTKLVRDASDRFSSVQKIQKIIKEKSFPWTCRTAGPLWKEDYIMKVTVKSRTKCASAKNKMFVGKSFFILLTFMPFSLTTPHQSRDICSWIKTMRKF